MVDNTMLIRDFIKDKFTSDDIFFFVQVMVRKKDDENMDAYHRIIQSYYIHSLQDFDNKIGEIKKVSEMFNARAYINPNAKSFKKSALYMMKELADCIVKEDYYHVKSIYNSVCGKYSIGDKYWLVDIDTKDEQTISEIERCIDLQQPVNTEKVVLRVPTKNGIHLITRTFDNRLLKSRFPHIDIHKDNPTLLYYKGSTTD